jgi:two-component system catabolic regulation response regulator CreB
MGGTRRILVVEDEPSVADTITYALATEQFVPVRHGTGAECLAALAGSSFDLVILDVELPDMSGFDVCRKIRQSSNVPIIFLTARAGEIDRIVGLEIGADDYLVKPFSPRELTARVRAVLRRGERQTAGQGSDATAPATPFAVDTERCTITYFGTPLALTRYEYRLLEVLVSRPGRIFSRETLMNRAWEQPEASMERTVDAHIKSIRAKLETVRAGEEPIQTHRGLGYALRESW